MSPFQPQTVPVRTATLADFERLVQLLLHLHAETPHARLCEARLREGAMDTLQAALQGQGAVLLSCTPSGLPVGTLGLRLESPWFSDEPWLTDQGGWMFVHPAHRRTPHARTLIETAMQIAAASGLPLHMAVTGYGPRTLGKIRLYSRALGQEPTGAIWNVRKAA